MMDTLLRNTNAMEKNLISYDTALLSNLISINSKELDQDIQELREFTNKLSKESSPEVI